MIHRCLALALLAGAVTGPAAAQQPKPAGMEAGKPWTHDMTGFRFPAEIAGHVRNGGTSFAEGGWDVSAEYTAKDGSSSVSVYLYQPAVQDAGMLIEEARRSLELRTTHYQNLQPLRPIATFAPPGDGEQSGLRLTYRSEGRFKSTAVAVAPLAADWVVKFRASSMTASAEQIDELMTAAIAALDWPHAGARHAAASVPAPCDASLPSMAPTKAADVDMSYALVGGLVHRAGTTATAKSGDAVARPRYCRDLAQQRLGTVYRPDGRDNAYVLAMGDSGRAVIVEPDQAAPIIATMTKKPKMDDLYAVRIVVPGQVIIFPPQRGMPSPDQAIAIVASGQPVATVGRGRNSNQINIQTKAK